MAKPKVRDVINESVNIGDEFGNEIEFESHERGSGGPLDGTVGVQAKVYFDNSTDLDQEVRINPNNGKKYFEFSVFDQDELRELYKKLERWLNVEVDKE